MSALVAIFAIFIASALGLLALIWYWLRQRARQEPEPHKPKRRKARNAAAEPEPEPDALPQKAGRRRLISAATLAAAEAAHALPAVDYPEGEAPAEPEPEALPPPLPAPITAAKRQAIVLRQHFPPHRAPQNHSWLGGSPVLPANAAWPTNPATGKPLPFLLQIDLAEVPPEARLGLLPPEGALAVFLDLDWGPGEAFRVIHAQGYAGTHWHALDVPPNLAMAYGDEAALAWPWALSPAHGTQILPRWPVAPCLVLLGESETPGWPQKADTARALLAAQGPEDLAPALAIDDFRGPGGQGFEPAWYGYPQDWIAVQIAAAALVREADRASRPVLHDPRPGLNEAERAEQRPEQRAEQLRAVREEAQAWFDHALNNPALDPLGPPLRKAFWDWLSTHRALAERVIPEAFEAAIETTMHASPQESARFPEEVTARVAYRHALARRTPEGVIAPPPARLLAPASGEAELAATHLLLLELPDDPAIGHHFGGGALQWWITPEDLADRRFDAVVMTRT